MRELYALGVVAHWWC